MATLWRYDHPVKYQERVTPVVGAVLWQRTLDSAPVDTPIMPDGCLDLLWDGNCLFVAGPDTAVRWHRSPAGTTYVALRFSGGLGPTLLGVAADELRDRTANLDQLWPGRQVRVLTEQVEADPRRFWKRGWSSALLAAIRIRSDRVSWPWQRRGHQSP